VEMLTRELKSKQRDLEVSEGYLRILVFCFHFNVCIDSSSVCFGLSRFVFTLANDISYVFHVEVFQRETNSQLMAGCHVRSKHRLINEV